MRNHRYKALLLNAQQRWTGRMDSRLQLTAAWRGALIWWSTERYKDAIEDSLAMLGINSAELESLVADRTSWSALCRQLTDSFEFQESRVSK